MFFTALSASILLAAPAAPVPQRPSAAPDFARVADVIMGAKMCERYGWQIDTQGLIEWSYQARDAAIAKGLEPKKAQAVLERAIEREHNHLITTYYMSLNDYGPADIEERFRHRKAWGEKCTRLREDEQVGGHFEAPIGMVR